MFFFSKLERTTTCKQKIWDVSITTTVFKFRNKIAFIIKMTFLSSYWNYNNKPIKHGKNTGQKAI